MARILMASTEYAPMQAGVANLAVALHGALSHDDEIFLFVPPGSVVPDSARASLDLIRPGPGLKTRPGLMRNAKRLSELVEKWAIDYILYMDPAARALAMPEAPQIPSMVYVHGTEMLAKSKVGELTSGRLKFQVKALRKAYVVVANSKATATLVANVCPDIQPEVVYPCYDPKRTFDAKLHLTNPFARDEQPFIFLTVSRLVRRKGHDQVLHVLAHIADRLPKFEYVIAGEGPARNELEALAIRLGLGSNVRFVGALDDEVLGAYYHFADLFIMLSKATENGVEGFGLTYVEAGASQTAVIGSNHGGAVEAVRHGETGLVIDPSNVGASGERILELVNDSKQRAKFGEAGQRWAEDHLSPQVIAARLRSLF